MRNALTTLLLSCPRTCRFQGPKIVVRPTSLKPSRLPQDDGAEPGTAIWMPPEDGASAAEEPKSVNARSSGKALRPSCFSVMIIPNRVLLPPYTE